MNPEIAATVLHDITTVIIAVLSFICLGAIGAAVVRASRTGKERAHG